MNISEVIKGAPKYLIQRYISLNSYVWDSLFPPDGRGLIFSKIKSSKERKEKLIRMKTIVDEATVLVFIFITRKIFIEGSVASKNTVDTLEELGVKELFLGKKKFFKRNKNVVLGDKLAQRLLLTVKNDIKPLLTNAKYVSDIIDQFKKVVKSDNSYNYLFDQEEACKKLKDFFASEKPKLNSFGSVVNQVFEAYTFASTIKWYQLKGWKVDIINPTIKHRKRFQLKFSTRGAPNRYSYAFCSKGDEECQIRHQLRVATKSYKTDDNKYPANICCDIVILKNADLSLYSSDQALPNNHLISFGEVKHMSAFAELIAGFIGVVHELLPSKLRKIRTAKWTKDNHISPYLNVSGLLQRTAKGLNETIEERKYDVDVYCYERKINGI